MDVCVIKYIYPAAYDPNEPWQQPGFSNKHGQILSSSMGGCMGMGARPHPSTALYPGGWLDIFSVKAWSGWREGKRKGPGREEKRIGEDPNGRARHFFPLLTLAHTHTRINTRTIHIHINTQHTHKHTTYT